MGFYWGEALGLRLLLVLLGLLLLERGGKGLLDLLVLAGLVALQAKLLRRECRQLLGGGREDNHRELHRGHKVAGRLCEHRVPEQTTRRYVGQGEKEQRGP